MDLTRHHSFDANGKVDDDELTTRIRPAMSFREDLAAEYDDEDFEFDENEAEKISVGSEGVLYKVAWHGTQVVAKIAARDQANTKFAVGVENEIFVLSQLRHPHIVQFLGAKFERDRVILLEELLPGGTLEQKLFFASIGEVEFEMRDRMKVAFEVASAVNYIHKKNMIHRDIKATNIMFSASGSAKLVDFGFCKKVPPKKNTFDKFTLSQKTGTFNYMAPEVYLGQEYDEKIDVHSFSMVLYYLLTGLQPFYEHGESLLKNPQKIARYVAEKSLRPTFLDHFDPDFKKLISECWHPDPDQRPGFQEILQRLQHLAVTKGKDFGAQKEKCLVQ